MFRALSVLLLLAGTAAIAADPVVDAKTLDKTVAASLRDVHDRGADLYNQLKDYSGAYRLYEGALLAVKPLLGHRPEVQKAIDEGLAAANKEPELARKAFLLHEAIEKTRADLKVAAPTPKVEPKPEPKPVPMPMPPVKPKEPEPKPMPPAKPKEPEPKPKEPAPLPKPKEPAKDTSVSGKVTVKGQPLTAGTVTFVLQGGKDEKLATGVVKDGAFTVKGLAPGKYSIAVIGKPAASVPAKFGSEETSGLVLTVLTGANEFNIELK
ncbi:MAG: hypothetical protein U0791_12525 [Gemmataceae bacterium]